jgi:hypothetical protein
VDLCRHDAAWPGPSNIGWRLNLKKLWFLISFGVFCVLECIFLQRSSPFSHCCRCEIQTRDLPCVDRCANHFATPHPKLSFAKPQTYSYIFKKFQSVAKCGENKLEFVALILIELCDESSSEDSAYYFYCMLLLLKTVTFLSSPFLNLKYLELKN